MKVKTMKIKKIMGTKAYIRYSNPSFKRLIINSKKKNTYPNDLLLGFELETIIPEDAVKGNDRNYISLSGKYKRLKNIFYVKHDCSVFNNSDSYGVEFNTHPFNWNWFLKNKMYFYNFGKFLKEYNCICNRTCGFHVHINKTFFKDKAHLYRFLYMFYREPNSVRKISKRVSQKTLSSYATPWLNSRNGGKKIDIKSIENLFGEGGWLRLSKDIAANTFHNKTIEVRIFQSTINPLLFTSYLEYCMALAIYTKNKKNKLTINNYRRYITKNKNKYPNLFEAKLFNKNNLISYKSSVSSMKKDRFWKMIK